ncbi:hypothetical protein CDCA_CDCA11G3145 [Cyanidium caldarium]|uniref:Serine/threonine-protein phosphatase n=1 Tax=Cyanidium caldarium TaxID=2771 RepID=A0AAV9IYF1_CYACA|nr:hypothetical protein CDCA_CDCA11G3145 [Cyanidium caldarium]
MPLPRAEIPHKELDVWIDHLRSGSLLDEEHVQALCAVAREQLSREGNLVPVRAPVVVVGDLHGQFRDLNRLLDRTGLPPQTRYLFLGDYVDRGYASVETWTLLLALFVRHAGQVALLRGNHESRQITQVYGFYDECVRKYGNASVWRYCVDVFDWLPLGAVIDERIFCVHGGLSPALTRLEQIQSLERVQEVPSEGAMCDLLWSDPDEVHDWTLSPRGAGCLFGARNATEFCEQNRLDYIVRSHQLVMEGYRVQFSGRMITVWSAPNYCYRCGNVGAVMRLDAHLDREFLVLEASEPDKEWESLLRPSPQYFL